MIGEPIALTIRRKIARPAAGLLRAYKGRPTGFITDAYNGKGCLDFAIKPLTSGMKFCGPAVTALCGPMDNLAAMAALDFVKKGDVVVIAAAGDEHAAIIGDLWALRARQLGVVGIVVDGLVRDFPGLLKARIPVFARGIAPNAGFKNGPGEVNGGVTCGGVSILPGDIVSGDQDGVVCIPLAEAESIAVQLKLVEKKEAEAEAQVKRGEKRQFWNEKGLGARVKYLD